VALEGGCSQSSMTVIRLPALPFQYGLVNIDSFFGTQLVPSCKMIIVSNKILSVHLYGCYTLSESFVMMGMALVMSEVHCC